MFDVLHGGFFLAAWRPYMWEKIALRAFDTLFDVTIVHNLGRVELDLKTGLVQHTLWQAPEVADTMTNKLYTHAVALEHNKRLPASRTRVFMLYLQFNSSIVLLKKLENFVAEPVLNSDNTWEVMNHALKVLVKYSALPTRSTPTSCFWTSSSR